MNIQCRNCMEILKVPDEKIGKKGKCHKCGNVVEISRENEYTSDLQVSESENETSFDNSLKKKKNGQQKKFFAKNYKEWIKAIIEDPLHSGIFGILLTVSTLTFFWFSIFLFSLFFPLPTHVPKNKGILLILLAPAFLVAAVFFFITGYILFEFKIFLERCWLTSKKQIQFGVSIIISIFLVFGVVLIQANSEPRLEDLIQQLKDSKNWISRKEAAFLLGKRKKSAINAVPTLLQTLKDMDADVRETAMDAVKQIEPKSLEFLDALEQIAQHDENRQLRKKAEEYLKELRPRKKPDIEEIKLQQEILIAKKQKEQEEAVPLFLETLNSPSFDQRRQAIAEFLKKMEQPEKFLPVIFQLLQSKQQYSRYGAIEALAELGIKADSYRRGSKLTSEILKELFIDPEEGIRFRAAWAVWKITKKTEESLPILIDCLQKTEVLETKKTISYLFTQPLFYTSSPFSFEITKKAISVLILLLQDPDRDVRYNATLALGEFRSSAKIAIPALKKCLQSNNISFIALEASLRKIDGNKEEYFSHTHLYYLQIRELFGLEQWEEALKKCNEILQLDPQLSRFYVARGNIYYLMCKKENAFEDATRAIEMAPNDIETVHAYNIRGLIKLEQNDFQGTLKDGNEAIRLNPNYFVGYYLRGAARIKTDDVQGATLDADKAIELMPSFAPTYFLQGSCYHKNQEDKKAKEAYKSFLRYSARDSDFDTVKMREHVFKIFPELQNE
jgi:HEAT repeat protein